MRVRTRLVSLLSFYSGGNQGLECLRWLGQSHTRLVSDSWSSSPVLQDSKDLALNTLYASNCLTFQCCFSNFVFPSFRSHPVASQFSSWSLCRKWWEMLWIGLDWVRLGMTGKGMDLCKVLHTSIPRSWILLATLQGGSEPF